MNEAKKEENNVELILSKRFNDILFNLAMKGNKIVPEIKNLETNKQKFDVSFIDITDKDDTISYITSNKAKPILDKYLSIKRLKEGLNLCWVSNRQEQKLSRFITRIFGSKFGQMEIENFVKEYKVELAGDKTTQYFELVKGEDVKKYYNGKKYSKEATGQLQRSCMRYNECEPLFDILVNNPEKMNMLILKDPNTDRIYGRANIWYLDNPVEKIFMDRIYTTHDWQVKLFIDYAVKNKWIYKSRQIYGGSVIPVIEGGKKDKIIMSVNLKPKDYEYYPYIDTLQFYNPKTGELTSDVKKFHDIRFLTLVLANGRAYQDDGETYRIDYLGRIVHEGNLRWSEIDQVYVHFQDAVLLDYMGEESYVTPDHEFVKVDGMVCLKEHTEIDPETGKPILKKNF
jgi:hypothetical protein